MVYPASDAARFMADDYETGQKDQDIIEEIVDDLPNGAELCHPSLLRRCMHR